MSLGKVYFVQCDGVGLASRLGMTASGPGVLFHNHELNSPVAGSAAKARRTAIKAGWGRITKTLPIGSGLPETDYKFDLCPSCKALLENR